MTTWRPSAKEEHYGRTGEATWDCTACCLDGHEARAHKGRLGYALGLDGQVDIFEYAPCLLLAADALNDITQGSLDFPRFGHVEGDLLRLEAKNGTLIYRLTRQPRNDRPFAYTPVVAELSPIQGDFYLLEWPD
jgi:hypothetical protein